ncbi:radical SAM protein [uncultured Paludibaculum sp.]|uniref:radical SAM protein n=1 Tax=uncultured Paludibaculum sp. TaxID=1765020 RepID=UPI002AAAE12B|nr:radical SAM protein [uncultured Paludibaculum sp.]
MPTFSQAFDSIWGAVSAAPDEPLDSPAFGSDPTQLEALLTESRLAKSSLFGNTVFPVSPLYVTSICKEKCTYCNYRAGSSDPGLKRVRLSDDELAREVEFLVAGEGLRAVELVYASDPAITHADIARHLSITRRIVEQYGGHTVGLSAEPMSVDEYKALKDVGLTFSVVWQETYDPARYAELHPGTQIKSNFRYRLESFERMIQAGLEGVGYGVLSGLADWRRDWSMLLRHQQWLRDNYGRGCNILGMPRLKAAPGSTFREFTYAPNDDQFLALVALHNVRFPDVRAFVSTREEFALCLRLAEGGGCLFTLDCSTVPGGYTLPNRGAQFVTGNYAAPQFAPRVEATGLKLDWFWSSTQSSEPLVQQS